MVATFYKKKHSSYFIGCTHSSTELPEKREHGDSICHFIKDEPFKHTTDSERLVTALVGAQFILKKPPMAAQRT